MNAGIPFVSQRPSYMCRQLIEETFYSLAPEYRAAFLAGLRVYLDTLQAVKT